MPALRSHAAGFADHVSQLCVVSLQCPSIRRNRGLNECKTWFQGLSQPYEFSTESAAGANGFRFLGLTFSVYKSQTPASAPSASLGGHIWGSSKHDPGHRCAPHTGPGARQDSNTSVLPVAPAPRSSQGRGAPDRWGPLLTASVALSPGVSL